MIPPPSPANLVSANERYFKSKRVYLFVSQYSLLPLDKAALFSGQVASELLSHFTFTVAISCWTMDAVAHTIRELFCCTSPQEGAMEPPEDTGSGSKTKRKRWWLDGEGTQDKQACM